MIICLDQRTGGGCGNENSDDAVFCRFCGRSLRFALMLMDPNTVVGAYRVLRLVGYGGGGAVYAAEDMRDARRVAIKETFDSSGVLSFRDEFAALHQLQHAGLPRYHEIFEFGGSGYLVMEFVAGKSLQDLVEERGALPEAEALDYARQLCTVLAFLHAHTPPLLHRDIKPANIRITKDGTIKLVDFGLLKRGSQQTRKTIRGMGTPAYAPIEQYATAEQHTDVRSDVYSLGATMYHLLTGAEPAQATERAAVTPDPLLSPRALNPALTERTSAALQHAMAIRQQDRFASVAALAAALLPVPMALPQAPVRTPAAPTPIAPRIHDIIAVRAIQAHDEGIVCLALRSDGEVIATGSADDTASVWRVYDGARLSSLVGHGRGVNGLAFTSNGEYLATGSADATVKFWRLVDSKSVLTLEKHNDWVLVVAASPDGRVLASGSADGMVWLWHMENGLPIGSMNTASGVWSIAWRSDNVLFATGHEDGGVQIRQRDDGRLVQRFHAHENIVRGVSWSGNGALLATASNDRTSMLWSATSGKPLRSLDGHTGNITSVAFSPDSSMVATGCIDGNLRVFAARDATLLVELPAHERGVNALVWLPDNKRIATAGMDGAIRVWELQ